MKEMEKEFKIEVAKGIICKITISRHNQAVPSDSDKIIAKLRISLPIHSPSVMLIPDIQFYDRLFIAGKKLERFWGYEYEKNFRSIDEFFYGEKWSKVFAEAEIFARSELDKLSQALASRAKALEDAEE